MDADGYPEESELQKIREWDLNAMEGDPLSISAALLAYVRERWSYAEVGYWTEDGDVIYASTGGWSGNEELLGALQDNPVFWATSWLESRRGGHHVFARSLAVASTLEADHPQKWSPAKRRKG